jgi:DNA-binding Lrp family transcriptional regulator
MEEKVIKRLNRLKEKGVIKDYAIGGAHAVS